MVELIAELTRNFGVIEKVVCAATADTARPVQPILIDILSEREFWPPSLLRANGHG